METVSKFASLAGKKFMFAKLGAKTSDEIKPELIASTAPNKFQINRLGSQLLGIQSGDRVKLVVSEGAENINDMYYIVVASKNDKEGAKVASVNKAKGTGKSLVFNFSGVWSKLVQMTTDATELSPKALAEKGLCIEKMTTPIGDSAPKKVYASKVKVFCEIVDTEQTADIDGNEYHIYALTNITSAEVDTDDEDVDDEDENGNAAE